MAACSLDVASERLPAVLLVACCVCWTLQKHCAAYYLCMLAAEFLSAVLLAAQDAKLILPLMHFVLCRTSLVATCC
jgi:hypothetical protein